MKLLSIRAALLLALVGLAPLARAQQPTSTEMVVVRDGVALATDVYLPAPGTGRYPVVLIRTPYGRSQGAEIGENLRSVGVATVVQDTRGRFDSEGIDCVFQCDGGGDLQDGVDTVLWIEEQTWFDDKIVTWGGSALGIVQYAMAPVAPDSVKAMWPTVGTPSFYEHALFPGGVFRKNMIEGWLSGQGSSFFLDEIADHPLDGPHWRSVQTQDRFATVNTAGIHVGGWYDIFIQGPIDGFVGWQHHGGTGARGQQKLIMGPWVHDLSRRNVGELTYPPNSADIPGGLGALTLLFVEHHLGLQPNQAAWDRFPSVHYYVMGDVDDPLTPGNEWRTADDWPIPAAPVRMHLYPGGGLGEECPPLDAAAGRYTYDPADPTPTRGGPELILPAGPFDQRQLEARDDVLTFTTEVLSEPLEITGRVRARLFVSIDQPDTDIMVRMTDVYPDGRSMLVLDGTQRIMARDGLDRLSPVEPGEVIEVTVDLWSTSIILAAGHRLRISVTSSNSPRFRPSPNDGSGYGEDPDPRPVEVSLHHDRLLASYLEIPVPGRPQGSVNYCGGGDEDPAVDDPGGEVVSCGCAASTGQTSLGAALLLLAAMSLRRYRRRSLH